MAARLTLRLAGPDDAAALRRLSERDSRRLGPGPHLVAERDGSVDAAVSLNDGALVADPFKPTADLCVLLRGRAEQLQAGGRRPRRRLLRPRPRLVAQ